MNSDYGAKPYKVYIEYEVDKWRVMYSLLFLVVIVGTYRMLVSG